MTYDGDSKNSVFTVHKPDGKQVHFWMHPDGLHYHDPKQKHMALINTIKKNKDGFTPCQIASAKATHKLQAFRSEGNPEVQSGGKLPSHHS